MTTPLRICTLKTARPACSHAYGDARRIRRRRGQRSRASRKRSPISGGKRAAMPQSLDWQRVVKRFAAFLLGDPARLLRERRHEGLNQSKPCRYYRREPDSL